MHIAFRRTIGNVLIAAIAASHFPAMAAETIDCESRHGRYKFCRVETEGRVELSEEYSSDRCREGRSWGYEERGVWVDRGCSGRFEVGYEAEQDKQKDKDKDRRKRRAAVAVGVVGLAALAALAASNSKRPAEQDQQAQEDQPEPPPSYRQDAQYESQRWNVGDFIAYDSRLGTVVKITVQPDGALAAYSRRGDKVGNFHGTVMSIGDTRFRVEPMDNGFLATAQYDAAYQMRFERQRVPR